MTFACDASQGNMRTSSSLTILTAFLVLSSSLVATAKDEWGPGIKYTTSWKKALREVQKTGKILLIYNGWERPNI